MRQQTPALVVSIWGPPAIQLLYHPVAIRRKSCCLCLASPSPHPYGRCSGDPHGGVSNSHPLSRRSEAQHAPEKPQTAPWPASTCSHWSPLLSFRQGLFCILFEAVQKRACETTFKIPPSFSCPNTPFFPSPDVPSLKNGLANLGYF